MKPIEVTNPFIQTKNVRNFNVMMEGLMLAEGEGCFGVVYGEAGLGKSRTAQKWYGRNVNSVYIQTREVWGSSYTEFLQILCRELGMKNVPYWKSKCFTAIVNILIQHPKIVFIDEIERLSRGFLEVMRDLTNITGCPVVLIGEEELPEFMKQNRRVWSRTFQRVAFQTINAADIMLYFKEASGIMPTPEVAAVAHQLSGGNFRDIRRIVLNLVQICNAKKTNEITTEMVQIAYKTGLKGQEEERK